MNQSIATPSTYQYRSFLVRLWQDHEHSVWYGAVTHVVTGEQLLFDNLEHLFVYLLEQTKTAVNHDYIFNL